MQLCPDCTLTWSKQKLKSSVLGVQTFKKGLVIFWRPPKCSGIVNPIFTFHFEILITKINIIFFFSKGVYWFDCPIWKLDRITNCPGVIWNSRHVDNNYLSCFLKSNRPNWRVCLSVANITLWSGKTLTLKSDGNCSAYCSSRHVKMLLTFIYRAGISRSTMQSRLQNPPFSSSIPDKTLQLKRWACHKMPASLQTSIP